MSYLHCFGYSFVLKGTLRWLVLQKELEQWGIFARLEHSRGWGEQCLRAGEVDKLGAFANCTECGIFAPGKKDALQQHSAIFVVR